ncbi:hypothetical protein [Vibrio caribbeanicus]|uniref:Uncharacterized protein n=1 Tax=Vibrio caribbeanicus ATCC BAA-2122 TaxID=796620 RepID=E3BQ12_9VIBR|nr:hypothetical protein [Vibrio caribbeanicus]EFP94817.1 hypothetical protein VIBC2010_16754 [Vibrio caribbeanicus ATCC BAA-2122]
MLKTKISYLLGAVAILATSYSLHAESPYNKGYEVACLDGAVELYAESITLDEKLIMYNFISEIAHKQDSSDGTLTKRDFLNLSLALILESNDSGFEQVLAPIVGQCAAWFPEHSE